MPGGKITAASDTPDLEGFLARRRYPLIKWLQVNNITSSEALDALLGRREWVVSPTLIKTIHELLKPLPAPPEPIVITEQPRAATVFESTVVEEPIATSSMVEEVAELIVDKEEPVIVEEQQPVTLQESLIVSYKERKKTR